MAAGHTQTDVLSRVRREQRMHGKPSSFSGLRIVLAATAVTLAILLFAFGAIGVLMMARAPQEPLATRFDPAPPVAQQTEVQLPAPQAELEVPLNIEREAKAEAETKTVKTLRVIAPQPAPENKETVQQPLPEPETTATIPQAQQQPQQVPQRPVRQQQAVRRPAPETQNDNPLFQLFGIKKYR
ncbi:MAG: hypothetical protein K2P86_13900 [Xanthobacteraceae bacterium]|nr:hypothetical protein [Xanthobacteraceae bacterium]